MKTADDFRPLFEGMTEMDFNSLMTVCFEYAYKNKIEIETHSDDVDELTSNLEEAERKIEDLEDTVKDIQKEAKAASELINEFVSDFQKDFPDYDARELEKAQDKLDDIWIR